MDNALVSIIIPIYNVSEYLDACVQSACNQTYSNLEIILVDDGSPDDCPTKCDFWNKKDARIKVIHKKNGGLSDARNAGLDIATGKYIYFLDGDDSIKPELVATVVPYMDNGTDMVSFRYDKVSPDGSAKAAIYQAGIFELNDPQSRVQFITQKLLTCKIGWEAWSRMYSRELIEKYHLRFADNRVIFAEDLYFCLCYCAHAERVISIANSLYCYSIREDSIMGRDSMKLNTGRMNELSKAALTHFKQFESTKGLVDCFPIIHYLILDNVLGRAMITARLSIQELRHAVREDITDWNFFQAQMKLLPKYRNALCQIFSGSQAEERISIVRFILDGNYTALRIRNRVIYQFADVLDRNTESMKAVAQQYRDLVKQNKIVYLLGTEEYGNIGDHQINESVATFLRKVLPEHTIHEVTAREWKAHRPFLKKCMRDQDLIVFAGGGNFGDSYPFSQGLRNEIIRLWPKNPKIVFPQTIAFSQCREGIKALEEACSLYTKGNHISLFAREQPSFDFTQAHFSCDSYLVPDIVLSSDIPQGSVREQRILLCFRNDVEKFMSEETATGIKRLCITSGLTVKRTDLQLDYHVVRSERRAIIQEKLDLWRQSKLVITDRLHGMVFAAITGTPCIVFSNYNHKVRGTYEWIKYLPYIRFAETVEDVERYLPELLAMENCQYDNTPLMPYFEELAQVVRDYANY